MYLAPPISERCGQHPSTYGKSSGWLGVPLGMEGSVFRGMEESFLNATVSQARRRESFEGYLRYFLKRGCARFGCITVYIFF